MAFSVIVISVIRIKFIFIKYIHILCLQIIVYKYTSALILSVYFIVIKQCPYLTGVSTNVNVTAVFECLDFWR